MMPPISFKDYLLKGFWEFHNEDVAKIR